MEERSHNSLPALTKNPKEPSLFWRRLFVKPKALTLLEIKTKDILRLLVVLLFRRGGSFAGFFVNHFSSSPFLLQ